MCLCGLHLNISYFIDYSTAKYKIDKLNGTGWIASNKFFSLLLHSRLDWSLVHRRVTRRLNRHQTTCHRALNTECHGNINQQFLIFRIGTDQIGIWNLLTQKSFSATHPDPPNCHCFAFATSSTLPLSLSNKSTHPSPVILRKKKLLSPLYADLYVFKCVKLRSKHIYLNYSMFWYRCSYCFSRRI